VIFRAVKRLRSEFGITQMHASRMAVRAQAPWYWRGVALGLIAAAIAVATWWLVSSVARNRGTNQPVLEERLSDSEKSLQRLSADNAQLQSGMASLQRQAQIDLAAQKELSRNVMQLQEENAHLKEEVTFFRSIMSSGKVPEGLSVQNFHIEPDTLPNEYRFHVLLVQGGLRERDFVGRAQLIVNLQKDGATIVLTLPEDEKSASPYVVNLKYYQRLEGRFKVPAGMVVKSAQLRVTEKSTGQVRITRSLTIS
jgi:cell division protein FtsB